jgi:hypothetical protein
MEVTVDLGEAWEVLREAGGSVDRREEAATVVWRRMYDAACRIVRDVSLREDVVLAKWTDWQRRGFPEVRKSLDALIDIAIRNKWRDILRAIARRKKWEETQGLKEQERRAREQAELFGQAAQREAISKLRCLATDAGKGRTDNFAESIEFWFRLMLGEIDSRALVVSLDTTPTPDALDHRLFRAKRVLIEHVSATVDNDGQRSELLRVLNLRRERTERCRPAEGEIRRR